MKEACIENECMWFIPYETEGSCAIAEIGEHCYQKMEESKRRK